MEDLETGVLFIKSKKLEETSDHVSRLSIRCMTSGKQYYKVGGHDHLVTPKNYLVVNKGQHYRTSFQDVEEQEMILIAFKPGFAEQVLYSMITPEDKLLQNPFGSSSQPVLFFEKTYDKDPVISGLFDSLRKLINEDISWKKTIDLDSIYTTMLSRLLYVHRNLFPEINKADGSKHSTRVELFRRLSLAKDFMDANSNRKISIDEISKTACLSPHHFKRTFKKLFGVTPHTYHVKKRLDYSCELLNKKDLHINEICQRVGFEDTSSFIRLFRNEFGCTPGNFA